MPCHRSRVNELVIEQLERGEMRLLALVVAVRRQLGRYEAIKGDLSEAVRSALRQLIAAKVVLDVEGVYVLAKNRTMAAATAG